MLVRVRVEVESGGIRHISSRVVRNNCDVIAYLVLLRITLERIKRVADCHIRRPGISAIEAVGIKELRVGIVRSVARVQPDRIDSAVRRNRKRAKPVPLRLIYRVVIDPAWRAERLTPICAAHEHYVAADSKAGGLNTREHVNVVVRARAGTIYGQKDLTD